MIPRISKKRFLLINLAVAAVFPLIFFQIYRLTVKQHDFLVDRALRQHNLVIPMAPERGDILDRNLNPFATNLKVPSIYGVPRSMKAGERKELIAKLVKMLDLPSSFVTERLSKDKAFVWLKRHASVEESEAVRALQNSNLGVTYEPKRFYPQGKMLAHTIGFTNIDNQGLEGLELLHDGNLKGRSGYRRTKRDAHGRELVALEEKLVPPVNGANLILTIDQYIQFVTDQALAKAFKKWKAKSALAIVMNPKTGEVLAMSTQPAFNPNERVTREAETKRNRPITDIFEPGSVFKVVTAAAALDQGTVTVHDTFDCEQGEWRVRKSRIIHDVHPYGELPFPMVLVKSSNIGIVKIAQKLGEKELYRYIRRFGFGEKTEIDFPGEVRGILRPVEKWSKFSISSIPYGQEVAATAIQMIRAIAVFANGGRLVRPYLLKEIRDQNGVSLLKQVPEVSEPILKPGVVPVMGRIMERVVEEGTGKKAQIKGVRVAGKTGTTQKLDPNGGYSHSHFVGSFVGFAPAENPMLVMLVSIDDPKPYYYGGTVAAPVFKEVIERSLLHLGYVPRTASGERLERVLLTKTGDEPRLPKSPPQKLQGVPPQVR